MCACVCVWEREWEKWEQDRRELQVRMKIKLQKIYLDHRDIWSRQTER